MKKLDFIIIIIICFFAFMFYWIFYVCSEIGNEVTITVDGELYGVYQLNDEQIIEINDTNILEIKDGTACMVEANCPDELCLHQTSISKNGESIICLPNRIIITVESSSEPEYDAVVQ